MRIKKKIAGSNPQRQYENKLCRDIGITKKKYRKLRKLANRIEKEKRNES